MKKSVLKLMLIFSLVIASGRLCLAEEELTGFKLIQFDLGMKAYQKGNFERAFAEWKPLAEMGIAQAQNNLGFMYALGQGVNKDYAAAANWTRKAAEQGIVGSQFRLGFMYENGLGLALDYSIAANWYKIAAEQGNADAQSNLSAMFAMGRGVIQDIVYAHMWANIAASQ